MKVSPTRLNGVIAWLFMAGSACFVFGSVPAYLSAVGGPVDGITYFVGSLFFTAASFAQLVQLQTPGMTTADRRGQHTPNAVRFWNWLPHDRNWLAAITQFPGTLFFNVSTLFALASSAAVAQKDRHVWRPDIFGSTLFLVASVFGILALGTFLSVRPRSIPWRIAWLNMIGSILFMASAIVSFVVPDTGDVINLRLSIVGTLLGAVCFFIGAALLIPAWRSAAAAAEPPVQPENQRRPA